SNQKNKPRDLWYSQSHQTVTAHFDYLSSNLGKDIRGLLIDAFDEWLQVPKLALNTIKSVVNMLHTASLLRLCPAPRLSGCSHQIFGAAQTINSANHAYFLAFEALQGLQNPAANTLLIHEMINLHLGQGMDLYWRDSFTCPSETQYLEMVNNKTGGAF
ncbi:terpenoid synthase, partial [Penicillium waksmanii]|uniref:terpenoid synthase n=1 Tax=Penicillium waksmanii TaxID=69791 RepID=UPI002546AA28